MRIAITGATGMIGTELTKVALEEGHSVIAIVRKDSPRLKNIVVSENVTVINSDIESYGSIEGIEKCDMFFHLAWKETFGSERDNVMVQIDNIRYSIDAAKLAKSWGAKIFVGAGSQAEYGITDQALNSKTPVNPESGYGVAKYASGKMCKLFCEQNGIRFNWGRITSTYGELDSSHSLVMYLINSILDGTSPELTKCEQIWDYTYSKDMARELLSIGIKGKSGKTYSLGSGDKRTLKEYVTVIRDKINPNIELLFGRKNYYDHQPMFLYSDISELVDDTGFKPEYDFETGIQKVINYVMMERSKLGS